MKKDGKYRYTLGFGDSSEKNHMVGEFLEKIGNKKSAIIVEAVAQYLESHPEINMDCRRIQVKIKPDISWAELEEKNPQYYRRENISRTGQWRLGEHW